MYRNSAPASGTALQVIAGISDHPYIYMHSRVISSSPHNLLTGSAFKGKDPWMSESSRKFYMKKWHDAERTRSSGVRSEQSHSSFSKWHSNLDWVGCSMC